MSDSHDIDRIIFLHLSGEANLEEIQELRRWINSDPRNKEVFENLAEFWKGSKIEVEAKNKETAFSALLVRIKRQDDEKVRHISSCRTPTSKNKWRGRRIVAAVIGLFLASIVFQYGIENGVKASQAQETAIVNKQTPIGQKLSLKLPDGSKVWLNGGSSISYPEVFDSKERRVILEGEAFFDVQRDERRPLIVEIGSMYVSVLGTEFNVKAFPEEKMAKVALVSGKVKVDKYKSDSQYESFVLEPGEEITYSEASGEIEKQRFDLDYVTAWKDGTLIFHNDSFSSFVQKLERWYGVEVNVEGQPSDHFIVTGKFENENMENVLRTLQFSRDFEFTIEDKLLTIKF